MTKKATVNEIEALATIVMLLESIAPITDKRFRRQWCIGHGNKFDTAVNKLRELFNYEESK